MTLSTASSGHAQCMGARPAQSRAFTSALVGVGVRVRVRVRRRPWRQLTLTLTMTVTVTPTLTLELTLTLTLTLAAMRVSTHGSALFAHAQCSAVRFSRSTAVTSTW